MSKAPALSPRWSVGRCQFTLIAIAALIDRELKPEERVEVFAIASRTPVLRELSEAALNEMWAEVEAHAHARALDELAGTALAHLPRDEGLALSTYAHAADMALADRRIDRREMAYLDRLARDLRVPPAARKRIDRVMDMKNRF